MTKFDGITVEQAISKGLKELNLSDETAEVVVIQDAKKGFLGIGKQQAVVDITEKQLDLEVMSKTTFESNVSESKLIKNEENTAINNLVTYIEEIITGLGEDAKINVNKENNKVVLDIEVTNPGLIIGKHGRVLNALQYISQVYMHRVSEERISVVVDVGDYRQRREKKLSRIANETLKEVREYKQPVFLDPMPAFERKFIHAFLSEFDEVKTHSEGDEPFRYLVVEYNKEKTL